MLFRSDGRRVVTGSGDKTVKVWNLENGEQEGTSMEHESGIYGLAVMRDGTKIISSDVGVERPAGLRHTSSRAAGGKECQESRSGDARVAQPQCAV